MNLPTISKNKVRFLSGTFKNTTEALLPALENPEATQNEQVLVLTLLKDHS